MNTRRLVPLSKRVGLVAILAMPLVAVAQNSNSGSGNSRSYSDSSNMNDKSYLPFTHSGYWGINLGASDYEQHCTPGFACNNPDIGGKIYVGGKFNKWLGAEVGYVNVGKLERNGGDTSAQGINLSLVGTLPLNKAFSAFAKVGTTYGWTKTEGNVGATGKKDDFGLSYGAGVGYNVTETMQVVAEWDRHNFEFADEDAKVDMYSVGLKMRF